MKFTKAIIILVALGVAVVASADEFEVMTTAQSQQVMSMRTPPPSMMTLPVTSWVEPRHQLDARDMAFLATVPDDPCPWGAVHGLREACRQMLVAGLIHVPDCGKYVANTSSDYWRMYQVWTAPFKVEVPVPQMPQPLCLPPLQPCQPQAVTPVCVQPVRLELLPACREVCAPTPCAPICFPAAGAVAFGRPGERRERTIGGFAITPSFRPEEQEETCPPGGKPPCPPGTDEAGAGVNPGKGAEGPGQGHHGGYGSGGATLPTPPPGYGNTTPPWAGPPPPTTPGRGGGSPGGGDLVRPAH